MKHFRQSSDSAWHFSPYNEQNLEFKNLKMDQRTKLVTLLFFEVLPSGQAPPVASEARQVNHELPLPILFSPDSKWQIKP